MHVARPKARITSGELEILRIIWAASECGMREVYDALSTGRQIAETTVANRLAKMEAKRLIEVTDDRRPKRYRALVSQEETANSLVGDILEHVFGGSPVEMVMRVLSSKKLTEKDRQRLRDKLDQLR